MQLSPPPKKKKKEGDECVVTAAQWCLEEVAELFNVIKKCPSHSAGGWCSGAPAAAAGR